MPNANKFYTIKKGDTLSEIAQRHGTTTKQLCKINAIKNPDKIGEGQIIALNAKAVCKVTVQLLDRDRNPIPNAKVRMEYSGKRKEISSKQNGRVPTILTRTPEDLVRIFIARADGTWKQITEVASGWGNKLVTLVSPKMKFDGKTMPHPKDPSGKPVRDPKRTDKKPVKPPVNPETTEAKGNPHGDFGDGKGPKSLPKTDKNGLPEKQMSNDQAKFDFLKTYINDKIAEEDYQKAANKLKIEIELLIAIERQESKGSAFDKKLRPTILYERHQFSRITKRKYDKTNPDISNRIAYTSDVKDKKGHLISDVDRYGAAGDHQYQRLAKAYKLAPEAALESCSWGKYQIMGFNYSTCGYSSIRDFVAMMSESERKQLDAVTRYIEHNCLIAVRNKDWPEIARSYNGPNYWKKHYDEKLRAKYCQVLAERRKNDY